jgi:hypothetical protein
MRAEPENCENRNDPDLVQAFLKKWWVESDFKAPNLPLSLRFKGFCYYPYLGRKTTLIAVTMCISFSTSTKWFSTGMVGGMLHTPNPVIDPPKLPFNPPNLPFNPPT